MAAFTPIPTTVYPVGTAFVVTPAAGGRPMVRYRITDATTFTVDAGKGKRAQVRRVRLVDLRSGRALPLLDDRELAIFLDRIQDQGDTVESAPPDADPVLASGGRVGRYQAVGEEGAYGQVQTGSGLGGRNRLSTVDG